MLLASDDYACSIDPVDPERVWRVVVGLDQWFDSMHKPGGYAGPVAHWWSDCLTYTGPGLDWRYEGIIIGYLNLWSATGEARWLEKARRAGDDLIAGQLPSGNFRNSEFELNPGTGGTPHEAACDLALLRLSSSFRRLDDPAWESYYSAARRNLEGYYLARLWDPQTQSFRDEPGTPSFVPNKSATLVEALFAYARLSPDLLLPNTVSASTPKQSAWVDLYIRPTLVAIRAHQAEGGPLDGAIAQNSFSIRQVEKYFPFYIARCIPALLLGWQWYDATGQRDATKQRDAESPEGQDFRDSAYRAASFVLRTRYPNGSFPQVLYPGGRLNRWPQWVAGIGDILRTLEMSRAAGVVFDPQPSVAWLLAGQLPNGGMRTACGFGKVFPKERSNDSRDEMSVCGWTDKAFRFLSACVPVTGNIDGTS